MTNKEIKTPSLLDALLPILALVVMMGSAVYLFADNSSYGPNQIALLSHGLGCHYRYEKWL